MTPQNLKKDYTWNTIGVFAQNAISPLLLIAITRINGIYDSGIFSFAFSFAIILWAFGMWGGRTYQVSDVRHEFSSRSYIMVRLLLATVMLVAAGAFCFVNGYDSPKTNLILALVLFKVIESFSDAIYGILQVHNRLYYAGKSLSYKASLGFVSFLVIDLATKNILFASIGTVAANLMIITTYDLPMARSLEKIKIGRREVNHYSRESFRIIRRCAPVAIVIFMSMFSLNIPRYYIDKFHQGQIGYFGIIAMPITLIGLVMTFALQPNVVALSEHYDKRNFANFQTIIRNLAIVTVVLGILILIATYIVGMPLLQAVFGVDFTEYKTPLEVLVLGGIINALLTVLINILIVIRRFKEQFYVLLLSNVILVLVSMRVVREDGILGGAWLFTTFSLAQLLMLSTAYVLTLKRAKNAIQPIIR